MTVIDCFVHRPQTMRTIDRQQEAAQNNKSCHSGGIPFEEGDDVLEVGCGTGSTALLLADSVKQITAIDISSNMIDIASNKAKDPQIENVNFIQSTLFDDTLEKRSFDVILAFNFLHLLEDTPEAIRRINELLKLEGLFIATRPKL